ncbi:hypothetical protein FOBRF1_005460 [Fusarium oxysporum]
MHSDAVVYRKRTTNISQNVETSDLDHCQKPAFCPCDKTNVCCRHAKALVGTRRRQGQQPVRTAITFTLGRELELKDRSDRYPVVYVIIASFLRQNLLADVRAGRTNERHDATHVPEQPPARRGPATDSA